VRGPPLLDGTKILKKEALCQTQLVHTCEPALWNLVMEDLKLEASLGSRVVKPACSSILLPGKDAGFLPGGGCGSKALVGV
jgi:hypothetical protein